MKQIEFDIWAPVPDEPGKVHRVGQRTAQEVFAELRHRLDSVGLLPDEYFLMDTHWDNGREIPEGAGLFCTADYGGSEGIYLDAYLKWHEDGKAFTKSFITGKTLDESEVALDRMHLTASAIIKAIHSEGHIHRPQGAVMHLSAAEQQLMIDSLVQHRESLQADFIQTEQLLRRATGGILELINEVGERPMKISAFDKAVLAVHEGHLGEFNGFRKHTNHAEDCDLLVLAAGRPVQVGRRMTSAILADTLGIPCDLYLTACKQAVDTGDAQRVSSMVAQAEICVKGLDMAIYGEVIRYAYTNGKRHVSEELIKQCTREQVSAAHPSLLYIAAMNGDYHTCIALVEKGLEGGEPVSPSLPNGRLRALRRRCRLITRAHSGVRSASHPNPRGGPTGRIIHALNNTNNAWILERMVENGFQCEMPQQALDEPQLGGMA